MVDASKFAAVHIIKDNKYVYSSQANTDKVDFSWRDNQPSAGRPVTTYVQGEQDNGEIVWTSPMWITYN